MKKKHDGVSGSVCHLYLFLKQNWWACVRKLDGKFGYLRFFLETMSVNGLGWFQTNVKKITENSDKSKAKVDGIQKMVKIDTQHAWRKYHVVRTCELRVSFMRMNNRLTSWFGASYLLWSTPSIQSSPDARFRCCKNLLPLFLFLRLLGTSELCPKNIIDRTRGWRSWK